MSVYSILQMFALNMHSQSYLQILVSFSLQCQWPSNSITRREDIRALFEVMNPADEEDSQERDVPLPFHTLSKIIWLLRGKILRNILVN